MHFNTLSVNITAIFSKGYAICRLLSRQQDADRRKLASEITT
jgi:hypothetical protein